MPLAEVLSSSRMTLGEFSKSLHQSTRLTVFRLLDKIAKDILVCENKTVRRWDGSIGAYKTHLRKKMVEKGAV